MSEPIKIELEIDLEALKGVVEEAKDLNDNQELFSQLVEVYRVKSEIGNILDQLTSIETEAKGLIKAKADALYGSEWTAIKGEGYKITRSATGSVFNILPDAKPPKEFLVIKEAVDSKKVEEFIKEKGKLPKGLEYNPSRGSSIRVTING